MQLARRRARILSALQGARGQVRRDSFPRQRIGIYVYDPEGNRCETYWNTGLKAKQPYGQVLDLEKPAAELMKEVEESVRKYGETGFLDRERLGLMDIAAAPKK
jgi:hypothetical protein